MELQAIRYAAMVANMTFEKAVRLSISTALKTDWK